MDKTLLYDHFLSMTFISIEISLIFHDYAYFFNWNPWIFHYAFSSQFFIELQSMRKYSMSKIFFSNNYVTMGGTIRSSGNLLFYQLSSSYLCIILNDMKLQAPRTSKGSVLRSGRSFGKDTPSNHWQNIIECLSTLLSTLKENFVWSLLIPYFFSSSFFYINV